MMQTEQLATKNIRKLLFELAILERTKLESTAIRGSKANKMPSSKEENPR